MSSTASWLKRGFPETLIAPLRRRYERLFLQFIRRRGPIHPPLDLGYRQVFILPTRFGWAIGLLLAAMLLGSLNFNNNLGLFTTFLVAGIGLLSMHLAHRNLEGVRVRACEARPVFAGEPLTLSVLLGDRAGRGREGLVAVASLPDAPKDSARSEGVAMPADGQTVLKLSIPTRQRGWMRVDRVRLRTRWPLGWFEAWGWFWPEHRFLVWPRPADQAPPLTQSANRDASERAGDDSDEFHGLRGWREGDPLHRIAWKASQRHDQLLARQFTRPERDRLTLRLSDAPGTSLEDRISVVTRWVIEADRKQFEYGLDLGATMIESATGPEHRTRCLNALAEFG